MAWLRSSKGKEASQHGATALPVPVCRRVVSPVEKPMSHGVFYGRLIFTRINALAWDGPVIALQRAQNQSGLMVKG